MSYERLRKVPPLLEDFLSPCKSPEGRILGGSPLHTIPTKPPSGKSTPGGYAANITISLCRVNKLNEIN